VIELSYTQVVYVEKILFYLSVDYAEKFFLCTVQNGSGA